MSIALDYQHARRQQRPVVRCFQSGWSRPQLSTLPGYKLGGKNIVARCLSANRSSSRSSPEKTKETAIASLRITTPPPKESLIDTPLQRCDRHAYRLNRFSG